MRNYVKLLSNYWHTIRYLKFKQILGRVQRQFKFNSINASPANKLRKVIGLWKVPARRSQRMIKKNVFRFLNETHQINVQEDWNNSNWAKLWLYNLHYFDDLTAVNSNKRIGWHNSILERWINENPIGKGNGWEPYTISLRLVNWIKWSLSGNKLNKTHIISLNTQACFLSKNLETHLLGNHLFANAKALMFAGLFFYGGETSIWYKTGHKIFSNELSEQILLDGGNFELSTMYHSIILEDLLDLYNLHKLFQILPPNGIEVAIPKMINWLVTMCHPDGEISFFNDAALDNTPPVEELLKYAKRLGFIQQKPLSLISHLNESGYSRVSLNNAVAIIDRAAVGPDYLPGHAHADTLSFELSIFSHRVVVNSGTSMYGIGNERIRQRGTLAHATVVIDSENSSEVWSGFRVARRAKVYQVKTSTQDKKTYLSAYHDGYKRLPGKPIHSRQWILSEGLVEIVDRISGKGYHDIQVVFPLHPDVVIIERKKNNIILDVANNSINIAFEGAGNLEIIESAYHPEFGLSIQNNKLIYQLLGQLPVEVITRIDW
jgi:uncharacterized heparinase superfamily protein